MSDTGKQLEQLVREIESLLVPQGFTIESRERVFNDEGQQIAEFDIIISGNVGSSPVKVLLECRDRPSEGPAPGSWIEQLVGRRIRFKFDKVAAVSTTGFAAGAKEFADQVGIDLRSLTELNSDLITRWFRAQVFTRYAVLAHAQIIQARYPNQNEIQQKLNSTIAGLNIRTPVLILGDDKESSPTLSVLDVWMNMVDSNPQVFDGLEVNGQTRHSTILVMFETIDGHEPPLVGKLELGKELNSALMFAGFDNPGIGYYIKAEGEFVHIVAIVFQGKFQITSEMKPASKVYEYSRFRDEILATTIHFDFGDNEAVFIVSQQEST